MEPDPEHWNINLSCVQWDLVETGQTTSTTGPAKPPAPITKGSVLPLQQINVVHLFPERNGTKRKTLSYIAILFVN